VFVVFLQIGLGFLDLVGVAIIGILGALAVSGVASREPGNRVYSILSALNLEDQSVQTQATVLGLSAAVLLVAKTLISMFFTRKIIFFLSRRGAVISAGLLSKLLTQSLQNLQKKSMQENLYAITTGVSTITVGILATLVALIADTSLLLVMVAGLFVVDTTMAFSTLLVFSLIGLTLYKVMNGRAQELGSQQARLSIGHNQRIFEILGTYREAVVRNRRSYYSRQIGEERLKMADNSAEIAFMPNISKYVLELTVVIGSLAISAVQFRTQDAVHAVAVLSVFLAASTRIGPAVLRVQQGAINIKTSLGGALPTLDLIDALRNADESLDSRDEVEINHLGFSPSISATNLSLTYLNNKIPSVSNATFEVSEGQFVAVVGTSGAGKTTLIDLILGVLTPDSGKVKISGFDPLVASAQWSGAISYVPQDVLITQASIRDNVTMGYPRIGYSEELIWDALRIAQLENFVRHLPDGLDSQVGDRGVKISGGQRQRLGIARAMFTKPKLLVLDEATSSLDGQTEADVSDAVRAMHGKVTVLMIAHRLSTVRDADLVIYMDKGVIKSIGTFEQVRREVPHFDEQARLMGL
jgi:ABC-type multidrug transport system fused ATPase/permease subunit